MDVCAGITCRTTVKIGIVAGNAAWPVSGRMWIDTAVSTAP
jgi:hypothetical protein